MVKSGRRMKLETIHLSNVIESCEHKILLILARFAVIKNMKALATFHRKAIKVCVNIPAAAAVPVVV